MRTVVLASCCWLALSLGAPRASAQADPSRPPGTEATSPTGANPPADSAAPPTENVEVPAGETQVPPPADTSSESAPTTSQPAATEPPEQPPNSPSTKAEGTAGGGADGAMAVPATMKVEDDREPLPDPIAPATDSVSKHLMLSLSAGYSVPFGKLEDSIPQRDVFGNQGAFGLELAVGVSRQVMVGLWGQGVIADSGDECKTCSGLGFAGGPFVRYHLVQGMRYDPWISYGAGLRHVVISDRDDFAYDGIDWLRLTLGGDWYASSNIGLSPFLELGSTVFFSRPDDATAIGRGQKADDNAALAWQFIVGGRITLDIPGK